LTKSVGEAEEQRRRAAEKLEAERRSAQELKIAKQVQARLFPQRMPPAKTLEYAGICIQARQVGGDYCDFRDLGRDRLGLVLGDIAGKGIAAALLMANLQASMRSQCAIASDQPQNFLRSVNQLFYENTAEADYATFFFSEYDDKTRRLRYANCGHLPPFSYGAMRRWNDSTLRPPCWGFLGVGIARSRNVSFFQGTRSCSTPTERPNRSTMPEKNSESGA
jgi:serine phosphatase RsbU (regulator of sigma subunit)